MRVGCGLNVIIVAICDVVCPVLIVILYVLYRTVVIVVYIFVTKNLELEVIRKEQLPSLHQDSVLIREEKEEEAESCCHKARPAGEHFFSISTGC